MTCGVPQGHELTSIPEHSSIQCHVDDTKLLLNLDLQDQSNAIAKVNEDLCRIINWTFRNQLINPEKNSLFLAVEL